MSIRPRNIAHLGIDERPTAIKMFPRSTSGPAYQFPSSMQSHEEPRKLDQPFLRILIR